MESYQRCRGTCRTQSCASCVLHHVTNPSNACVVRAGQLTLPLQLWGMCICTRMDCNGSIHHFFLCCGCDRDGNVHRCVSVTWAGWEYEKLPTYSGSGLKERWLSRTRRSIKRVRAQPEILKWPALLHEHVSADPECLLSCSSQKQSPRVSTL